MDTDRLIQDLSKHARVSSGVWPVSRAVALYVVFGLLLLGVVLVSGKFFEALTLPQIVSIVAGFLAAYLTASVAIASSVPGEMTVTKLLRALLSVTVWLFIDELFSRAVIPRASHASVLACENFVILVSLPCAAFLLFFILRRAPLRIGLSTFFAFLSAGTVANILMRIYCTSGSLAHDVFFHLLPCALLLAIAVRISLRLFSWSARFRSVTTRT